MKKRYTLISGFIVLIFITVLIFRSTGIFNPFIDILTLALRPLQEKSYFFSNSIKSYLTKRDSIDELIVDNNLLREERDKLIIEKSNYISVINELKITRQEDNFLKEKGYRGIVAKIIGRSSDSLKEEVVINLGKNNGLKEGYAVIAQNGYLIGKVVETFDNISKVRLLIDRQCEVAALIQNDTSAPGIVIGQHGLSLKMELIPQNEIITKDQIVISSGLEANIPPGLVIGTIGSISLSPGDIFQNAVVISPVRYDHLKIVSVIIPSININD